MFLRMFSLGAQFMLVRLTFWFKRGRIRNSYTLLKSNIACYVYTCAKKAAMYDFCFVSMYSSRNNVYHHVKQTSTHLRQYVFTLCSITGSKYWQLTTINRITDKQITSLLRSRQSYVRSSIIRTEQARSNVYC